MLQARGQRHAQLPGPAALQERRPRLQRHGAAVEQ